MDENINTAVQKTDTYTIKVHTEMLLHGKVVIFLNTIKQDTLTIIRIEQNLLIAKQM